MLRSFRDKENVRFSNKKKRKLSVEHTGDEGVLLGLPALSLGDHGSRTPPPLLIGCLSRATPHIFSIHPWKTDCDIFPIKTLQRLSIAPLEGNRKPCTMSVDPRWSCACFSLLCYTICCVIHTCLSSQPSDGSPVSGVRCCLSYGVADFSYIRKSMSLKYWHVPSGLCLTVNVA